MKMIVSVFGALSCGDDLEQTRGYVRQVGRELKAIDGLVLRSRTGQLTATLQEEGLSCMFVDQGPLEDAIAITVNIDSWLMRSGLALIAAATVLWTFVIKIVSYFSGADLEETTPDEDRHSDISECQRHRVDLIENGGGHLVFMGNDMQTTVDLVDLIAFNSQLPVQRPILVFAQTGDRLNTIVHLLGMEALSGEDFKSRYGWLGFFPLTSEGIERACTALKTMKPRE